MFITGCTGSCQNDNFQCRQWWKFRQNDDIFVSVLWIWNPVTFCYIFCIPSSLCKPLLCFDRPLYFPSIRDRIIQWQCLRLGQSAMPETCKNWLGFVNSCVYFTHQNRGIYQILPYSVDFEAPGELSNFVWSYDTQMKWTYTIFTMAMVFNYAYDVTIITCTSLLMVLHAILHGKPFHSI